MLCWTTICTILFIINTLMFINIFSIQCTTSHTGHIGSNVIFNTPTASCRNCIFGRFIFHLIQIVILSRHISNLGNNTLYINRSSGGGTCLIWNYIRCNRYFINHHKIIVGGNSRSRIITGSGFYFIASNIVIHRFFAWRKSTIANKRIYDILTWVQNHNNTIIARFSNFQLRFISNTCTTSLFIQLFTSQKESKLLTLFVQQHHSISYTGFTTCTGICCITCFIICRTRWISSSTNYQCQISLHFFLFALTIVLHNIIVCTCS